MIHDGGQRNTNDVVLPEACDHHEQQCRFRRLACPVTGEEPDEAGAHDRERCDLRIVGADIGRGVVRHDGDEPERAERTGDQAAGEQPYRKRDLDRDGKKPDDGNGTTNEQVVAQQRAKPTDRVERQRRVIVDDELVSAGVERQAGSGGILMIRVPRFGEPYLQRILRPPHRPDHVIGRQRTQRAQIGDRSLIQPPGHTAPDGNPCVKTSPKRLSGSRYGLQVHALCHYRRT